ncbi:MAG: tRNA lysidine(34) synthetase TilS [Bacteroidota bacterium]
MLSRLLRFVNARALLAEGARVVVGVSGGVDSVVLLHLLRAAGYEVTAAHVNYGLRGADADADEALVRTLCRQSDMPLKVHRAGIEGSVQAAAREARYAFFGEVACQVGAAAVATAHHRDDQAETVLLNLFRGAGLVGLAGMPLRRPLVPDSEVEVIRPLLWAARAEIEAYARTHDLAWREDASNRSLAYRRNALRHAVLPLIEQHFGEGVGERIAGAADLVREALESEAALVPASLFEAAAEETGGAWALRLGVLADQPEAVRRGVLLDALRRWAPGTPRSQATVRELEALLGAQPGRRVAWPGVTVWRDRDRLVFEAEPAVDAFALDVQPGETTTPLGTLHVGKPSAVPAAFDASPEVEWVDADRLRFPLTLRPWQAGDAFQPLGMTGRKNVSDLLTERRVSPHERARQLVLLSGEAVAWVVGHRLGAAWAVGPETQRAVRLRWRPALPPVRSGA